MSAPKERASASLSIDGSSSANRKAIITPSAVASQPPLSPSSTGGENASGSLGLRALHVVCNYLEGDVVRELREDASIYQEREAQLVSLLRKMRDKYRDLVWFAQVEREDVDAATDIVLQRYSENEAEARMVRAELRRLRNVNEWGEYSHGFHAGMLAAARLFLAHASSADEDGDAQAALENFPDTDVRPRDAHHL